MDVALLRSYAEQGMTRKQIADALCIPYTTVSNNCTKHGIKTKRPKQPLCENTKKIIELRKEGLGYDEIAKRLSTGKWNVVHACHLVGLTGVIAEPYRNKLKEDQVAEYVSKSGFDYVGGYISQKKPITVRCRVCGRTFERQFHIFRDAVNGTWNAGNECPLCRNDKHLQYQERKEQKKADAEREAQKRAQQKAERLSRKISDELEKRLAIHVCKHCGTEFCKNVTGYNSETYCSQRCQTRWLNRTRSEKRYKQLMSRRHDTDISLERLYKRDNGICYICGKLCEWDDGEERNGTFIAGDNYPSVDHVIPVTKGGTHTWDNIKLAHRICNTMKSDS